MTDWDRLVDYIINYFPEPKYSSQDIRDWAMENVPAWQYMGEGTKREIIGDWENFIMPEVKSWLRRMSEGFRARIRRFLGRDN